MSTKSVIVWSISLSLVLVALVSLNTFAQLQSLTEFNYHFERLCRALDGNWTSGGFWEAGSCDVIGGAVS